MTAVKEKFQRTLHDVLVNRAVLRSFRFVSGKKESEEEKKSEYFLLYAVSQNGTSKVLDSIVMKVVGEKTNLIYQDGRVEEYPSRIAAASEFRDCIQGENPGRNIIIYSKKKTLKTLD